MISELALSIGALALAVLVYRRTGSAFGAAAFFLCAEFAPALVSPLLVARLDQRSVRHMITALYASEALVFLALVWLVRRFALVPVLALALTNGTLAVTAGVLVRTAWTSVTLESGRVRDANALMNTGFSVCFMLGPAIGGVLVAVGGAKAALLVNVGVYVVCALVVSVAKDLPAGAPDREPAFGRLAAALKYARREPLIRRLLGLQAAGVLFFTISVPVEVVFVQHTLHAGAGGYGVMLAAWGAGAIAGSAIFARWRRLASRLQITAGTALLGAGLVFMSLAPSLAVASAAAVLAGIGNGVQTVSVRTALQEIVAERWMALILSLNQSMFQAVPGAGIVLGGALAALSGTRIALAVGGVGSLAVASTMWLKLSPPDTQASHVVPITSPEQADALTAATRQK